MANWLARMFTIPHQQRDEINKVLAENPAALALVNGLKNSLAEAAVHQIAGSHSDPLEAALAAVLVTQQIERAIPTPHSPDAQADAAQGPLGTMLGLINGMAPSSPPADPNGPPPAVS